MNHFKEAAKSWDKESTKSRNQVFADAILSSLDAKKEKMKLLDFGCGTGLLSQYLVDVTSEVIGIDTTEEMLEEFDKKFHAPVKAKSICINLEESKLPAELGNFDLIVSAMAFHHLNQPGEVLKTLKDLVSDQGKIFVIDLDKEDGSFHPDNKKMGVKHFGFSEQEQANWAATLNLQFERKIVFEIEKNDRKYPVAMSIFAKSS